jgi:hypothetical protein
VADKGTFVQGPFSAQQLIKVARQLALDRQTEVYVDSTMLNEGTMWVYLDALLPLLENTYNLVNITLVGDSRWAPPSQQSQGAQGDKRVGQDGNHAGRDVDGGRGDGASVRGPLQGDPRVEGHSGFGRRSENGRWQDSGARLRGHSAGMPSMPLSGYLAILFLMFEPPACRLVFGFKWRL